MTIFSSIIEGVGLNSNQIKNVTINGCDPVLPTPFLVGETCAAAIAATGYAAHRLWHLKTGQSQDISINVIDAAIASRSHQYLRFLDHNTPELWDPVSGFYQTRDGRYIQLHCNFPNHRQGVIDFLGCTNDKESVIKAIASSWDGTTLEEELNIRGLCSSLVRSTAEWHKHPQYNSTADLPLLEIIKIGDSNKEPLPNGDMPLSGIKMLDLSRVIAGPMCGKTMAMHGATVMRISSPNLPSILPLVVDTGFGKLSAHVDLDTLDGKTQLENLVKDSDVFLQAYRPGGLDEKGFSVERLHQLRPGIIYISLSAYSHVGPWSKRHGYDSLVQSATGIVNVQGSMSDGGKPQHLPAQTLDYVSGYLAAFGAMEALRRRTIDGGSYQVRISLVQVANWLAGLGQIDNYSQIVSPKREDIDHLLAITNSCFGRIEHLKPVLHMSRTNPYYKSATVPLGTNLPKW